jgi:transcriptional regulator with AAA-type ATPase domain
MFTCPEERLTLIGRTNYRNNRRVFGIKQADRRHHMYIIGKTGVGKSTLLETLIRHDINAGHGLTLIDPHGDLVEKVLSSIPDSRRKDVIYFNVPDTSHPIAFNPLQHVPPNRRSLAASGMLGVFKRLWDDSWGPRLEHILRNALLALLDQPQTTLADVLRLLDDREFRQQVISNIKNQQVRNFWQNEFESYPARFRAEAIAPVQNKVGAFLADPILNKILTQTESSFRLRTVMDQGKILLVNLAKGIIGEDTASLLGSLLVARLGLAAMSRADVNEDRRRDFFLYLDEFHSFTTLSLAGMLSELRKYRLNIILAHQYLAQLSLPMRDARSLAERVAPTDANVLLTGESGTGKEVFAQAIHAASHRSDAPFVPVNCGAIPENLLESELFGHEKGAFTGADKQRIGRFEQADGGTLFLDEIGDMSANTQAKILRVLQEHEFERLGGTRTIKVDVRLIAATNRDLTSMVEAAAFREDLYYRLNVFPIEVPPLRERDDDIGLLASTFANRFAQRMGRSIEPLSEDCVRRLKAYSWPGNVRELQNVIERGVITSRDGRLNLERALPESTREVLSEAVSPERAPKRVRTAKELEALERDNLLAALEAAGWRVAGENGAAQLLDIKPTTLSSRMKALGIERKR